MYSSLFPTRADWVIDIVVVAMFGILFWMYWNIQLIRKHKDAKKHRNSQLALTIVFTAVVFIFSQHLRSIDWESMADQSRFYESGLVDKSLWLHLFFAKPVLVFWYITLILGFTKWKRPHKIFGKITGIYVLCTVLTALVFYLLAFTFGVGGAYMYYTYT